MRSGLRKVARKLSYRSRHLSMSSNDQVMCRKLKEVILYLCLLKKYKPPLTEQQDKVLKLFGAYYLSIIVDPGGHYISCPKSRDRNINSFTETECRINFRFTKEHLNILIKLLRFPDMIKLDNGIIMAGEEVFIRGLYEFVSGDNQEQISANVFGREFSAQSRAFKYFINHIYSTFEHLVHDNLDWWYRNGFFASSAGAIGQKINIPSDIKNLVAHFIDCNCLPTSVVGGGPAEEGANAIRWNELIQRSFYNGWKSIHGLKHQTIDNAFGMTVDMAGPTTLRRNDNSVLRMSNINTRMADIQVDEPLESQYIIMGDSAYNKQSHITSYHKAVDLIPEYRRQCNLAMKRVRISIEWNYGYTASLFTYVGKSRKLKVLKSDLVSKIYTVAILLRNIYVCLNGCQTSNYFNAKLPTNS